MNLISIVLVLSAPCFYWALGLPWVVGTSRARLAPLIGCTLAGLYAEWAMMAGLSVPIATVVALVISLGVVLYRRSSFEPAAVRALVVEWLPFYWVAILAASLSPFPVIGNWGGDWFTLFRMGESVFAGELPRTMLARPPLFGAATAPLWLIHGGLVPFQIMVAFASSAAATATLHFLRFLRPGASAVLLVPLLLSPFFLHHNAAAWPKLLSGGLVLVAAMEAFESRPWACGVLFALSVAAHEGYAIWAPCLLLCHVTPKRGWRDLPRATSAMAVTGLAIVGPLVVWVLWKYGLSAKIAANPVVTDRESSPFLVKTSWGVLTAFIGWAPVTDFARWLGYPNPFAWSVLKKEVYWCAASWTSTMAGTMAGVLMPFLLVARRIARQAAPATMSYFGSWVIAGVAIASVLNGALTGYWASWGVMQAALIPLALGAYALLVARIASLGRSERELLLRLSWATVIVGTLPWFVVNAGSSIGLWLSPSVRATFRSGSENDYLVIVAQHLSTLGLSAFPAVPVFSTCMLAGALFLCRGLSTGTTIGAAADSG